MDATLIKVLGHTKQIEEIVAGGMAGDDLGWEEKDGLHLLGIIRDEIESIFIKAGVPLPYDDDGGE